MGSAENPFAVVFDIQRFAVHDGPGIRTTVFFKGCPLSCAWCHNPESRSAQPILLYDSRKCTACGHCVETCRQGAHTLAEGGHGLIRERCLACGACVHGCFQVALELAGHPMTIADILAEVLEDLPFYRRSGGGMTLSGGEPLAQLPLACALLEAAKSHGLHTAVDTAGLCPWEYLEAIWPCVDLFLYDLKHMDPERHKALTGASNERIIENLRQLNQTGKPVWIRLPLIPGQNEEEANYHALGRFLAGLKCVERVEILRYHPLAESKYERMGSDYQLRGLAAPSAALAESRRRLLSGYGVPNVVWR
jgi:pyruvate formate lyase activating enzyme